MKKIVVIGGGTGSFTILSGLLKLPDVSLTAIVPATDSGGSTGRLRDEFGSLPVGDARQCLVALAESQEESILLRKLFNYRFDRGENGLRGHNLGNLFLTALVDILGGELEAIQSIEKLFNIQGHVYPVSLDRCNLVAEYENGERIVGEHLIDEPQYPHDSHSRIAQLSTDTPAHTYPEVINAITQADYVILGPGDLYTSLLANLVISGIPEAIQNSAARFVYILNLVTKFGQTHRFTAKDHVQEVVRYAGRKPDLVVVNDNHLPVDILERYKAENAYPVVNDLDDSFSQITGDFLARAEIVTAKGDVLKRSLIRHDGEKIARVVTGISL